MTARPAILTGLERQVSGALRVIAELDAEARQRVEMSRILRERDESFAYEKAHRDSGPGLPFSALSCGCTERTDCEWHAHVAECLRELS